MRRNMARVTARVGLQTSPNYDMLGVLLSMIDMQCCFRGTKEDAAMRRPSNCFSTIQVTDHNIRLHSVHSGNLHLISGKFSFSYMKQNWFWLSIGGPYDLGFLSDPT
jgi:hypothetical protein